MLRSRDADQIEPSSYWKVTSRITIYAGESLSNKEIFVVARHDPHFSVFIVRNLWNEAANVK